MIAVACRCNVRGEQEWPKIKSKSKSKAEALKSSYLSIPFDLCACWLGKKMTTARDENFKKEDYIGKFYTLQFRPHHGRIPRSHLDAFLSGFEL